MYFGFGILQFSSLLTILEKEAETDEVWSTFKRFRQIFTRKKYCLLSTVFTEMKATHSKKLLKAFEFYIVYVYLDHETFVSTDCLFLSKLLQYFPEDTVTYGIQRMHS